MPPPSACLVVKLTGHDGPISALAFSPEVNPQLFAASQDGASTITCVLDPDRGLILRSGALHVTAVAWSTGTQLFLGWDRGFVTEMQFDPAEVSNLPLPLAIC